ncbi:MAG: hypothetical protein QG604_153 [Candidatus Dependentiae bacterium]|nr:hypothetical protein [Candidatus Dependentiae bacterium]
MKRLAIALCILTSFTCMGRDSTPEGSPLLPALFCPTHEDQLGTPHIKKPQDKFTFGTRGKAVKVPLSTQAAEALKTLKTMLVEKMNVLFADKENVGPGGISLEKSVDGLIYYISTNVCYHSRSLPALSSTISALIWHIATQIASLTPEEGNAHQTMQALLDNAIKALQESLLRP